MSASDEVVLGIDLGTTFSCAAWISSTGLKILDYDDSTNTIPSWVGYAEKNAMVQIGRAALNKAKGNQQGSLYDSKRLIGKTYENVDHRDIERYPFKVVDEGGYPKYSLTHNAKTFLVSPTEISSKILSEIKQTIARRAGCEVTKVVITVPAYFKNSQREETRKAGAMAGFEVLQLINEPTAAAMAYVSTNKLQSNKSITRILVYDFGGGTFDVSVIELKGKEITVLSTGGDDHLGGQDVTNILLEHYCDKIRNEKGINVKSNPKWIFNLRNACEETKRMLSTVPEYEFGVTFGEDEYTDTITRAEFENQIMNLINRTIIHTKKTVKEGKLNVSDIDFIVLVGGSSKIPLVKEELKKNFINIQLCTDLNGDEAVASGAAFYANSIINKGKNDYVIHDVLNHTIGIKGVKHGKEIITPIVPKLSAVNSDHTFTFYNSNYATDAEINIYEGESKDVEEDTMLGKFCVTVPSAPEASIKIEIRIHVNENGTLDVTATCDGNPTTCVIEA